MAWISKLNSPAAATRGRAIFREIEIVERSEAMRWAATSRWICSILPI